MNDLYSNAVPDSQLEVVAKQVLGARLHAWSKAESGRMCASFERHRAQHDMVSQHITEEMLQLDLNEFTVPCRTDLEGKEIPGKFVMPREDYKRKRFEDLQAALATNVATLDKLTTIYLKLTAGGLGAILSGMKQAAQLKEEERNTERDATPRRSYGAGLSQLQRKSASAVEV